MLTLEIPGTEVFSSEKQEFLYGDSTVVRMEHSLASISKWESFWKKPFLGKEEKTSEEILSYIEFMCLTPDIPRDVFLRLSEENYRDINTYIGQEMTATWFSENSAGKISREIITSEIIYYWMFSLQLPLECEMWHFNRLMAQIKVINLKNQPKKKMSQQEVLAQQRELNQKRRAEANHY